MRDRVNKTRTEEERWPTSLKRSKKCRFSTDKEHQFVLTIPDFVVSIAKRHNKLLAPSAEEYYRQAEERRENPTSWIDRIGFFYYYKCSACGKGKVKSRRLEK